MSAFNNRDKLLKILGKYSKELTLYIDDEPFKVVLTYPKLENSIYFWDVASNITELYDKTKSVKEMSSPELMESSQKMIEPLVGYLIGCVSNEEKKELSAEEKDIIYILTLRNQETIIKEFSELFGALFTGDGVKKPQVEALPSE